MNDTYEQVAEIHMRGIKQGFLSSLGVRFLSLMYQAIDETENSALIIAREEGKIIGFVSGTLSIDDVYRSMLKKRRRLFAALLPSLFSPRRLVRILEIGLYGRKRPAAEAALPSAELLSISVAGEFRGKKHADRLYQDLIRFFQSRQVPNFKIVVGESLAPARRFYQRMGAKAMGSTEVHKGEKSIIYIQEVS